MSEQVKSTVPIDKLKAVFGSRLKTEQDFLEKYSHDETAGLKGELPSVVIFPQNANEISRVLQLANSFKFSVTPRGAGTGLSGGAVPNKNGVVLSLEKMNNIVEFDKENMMVTVEPGVITDEIQKLADKNNLMYAGDPCSSDSSTIGGNIAENAGGNKVIKYGPTGYHVYGLEVVLPTGEIVTYGGKRLKDVTGLDMIHLIIGSEGILGVVTKIILRLIPKPKYTVALLAPFRTTKEAIEVVPKILTHSGIMPSSLEFMDKSSIRSSCRFLNVEFPYSEAGAHLIIEVEGNDKESIADIYEQLGDKCIEEGALEVFVADNRTTRERLWKARKSIAEALSAFSPVHCMEDVSVPMANIAELIKETEMISEEYDLDMIAFGHAGDGNVHITFLKGERAMEHWNNNLEKALTDLYKLTSNLGGCITGEHGVGLKRKKYLSMTLDSTQIEMIRKIKGVFDPSNILNPGKIVDITDNIAERQALS